jgi:glycosyltransferase involved in cell wall biosynthesis
MREAEKMRILSVTPSPPMDNAMSWRILNILEILRSAGHEVDIVHYTKRSTYKKFYRELKNVNEYENDSFVVLPSFTSYLAHLKKLKTGRYDLIYGNTHSATFLSMISKEVVRVPLIFDMHGGLVEDFLLDNKINYLNISKFFLKKFIDLVDLRFSNRILCVSKKMIGYLHTMKGVSLEKMFYVPNGVDLDFFKPINDEKINNLKKRLGFENKFVFGYIGSFFRCQGVDNFIEAAKRINDSDVAFLIVGGAEKLREGNIVHLPRVPRSQIPNYYAVCDVLVLPMLSHIATEIAAPTKFVEYTSMGKPILATNVGDAAEFVRKYDCGIVVKNNTPENLIEGMNEFKNKSEEELKRMGKNSRRLAENEFDWKKVGINLLNAINSIH